MIAVLLPFEDLIDEGVDANRLTGETLYESANVLELRDRKKFVGVNAISRPKNNHQGALLHVYRY